MRPLLLLPVIALFLMGATTVSQNLTITVTGQSPGTGQSSGSNGILPPDRDASANWQKAGLLSVGGIPIRNTVCATLSPLGSGQDDTAVIQNAVNSCPLGQVVSLSAGTFTIAEGKYVLLNKGITLRGAGAGATILQRTNGAQLGELYPRLEPVADDHCRAAALQQQRYRDRPHRRCRPGHKLGAGGEQRGDSQ